MKIVLINPPYISWTAETQFMKKVLGVQAPLGLLSLASYSQEQIADLDIQIIDCPAMSIGLHDTVRRVVESRPELIGITMTTMAAGTVDRMASALKEQMPGVKIVIGGPHVSALKRAVLETMSGVDYAVAGEGEQTFTELIRAIRSGHSVGGLQGLSYRTDRSDIQQNPPREPIACLDRIPDPAWHLLEGFPQRYYTNVFCTPSGPAASVSTSRGCPYGCSFCDQSTFGNRPRMVSAAHMFDSVKRLQGQYGIRYISFCDDTFTIHRQRVMEFCELMRTLPRPIKWSCDANVLTVDDELLGSMKKAGCWSISYGLESGSKQILKTLNKNSDLGIAKNAVRMTRKNRIYAKGLFVLGTPTESAQTIEETKKFILSLPLSTINISKFTPYPGSPLYQQLKDQLPQNDSFDRYNSMRFILPSRTLSIEQLDRYYGELIRCFYNSVRSWRFHFPTLICDVGKIWRLLSIIPPAIKYKWTRHAACAS